MTSSNPTKVGSFQNKKKMVKTKKTVSTHKPLNLNFLEIILRYKELKGQLTIGDFSGGVQN
jgi:hypothetical protein